MENKILLQDLAERLALRGNISRRDAELFIRSVLDVIEENLQTDKIVKIKGLGTFKLVAVESRESIDVNTGERIRIKGYVKIAFTPDTVLRDQVNKPFAQFETVILNDGTSVEDMERLDNEPIEGQTDEFLVGNAGVFDEEKSEDETSDEENTAEVAADEDVCVGELAKGNELNEEGPSDEMIIEESGADDSIQEQETISVGQVAEEQNGYAEDVVVTEQPEAAVPEQSEESSDCSGATDDEVSFAGDSSKPADEVHGMHATVVEHQHTEFQKVAEQQVTELNVSSQRIEHQTVEHQSIVHTSDRKSEKKDNRMSVWAVVVLVFLILFLMAGSYLVGYYRLLCPCGFMDLLEETVPPVEQLKTYSEQVNRSAVTDSLKSGMATSDSLTNEQLLTDTSVHLVPVAEKQLVADTVVRQSKKDSPARPSVEKHPEKSESPVPAQQTEQNAGSKKPTPVKETAASKRSGINAKATADELMQAKKLPQIAGGKYLVVGTRLHHTLKSGESLRRISLKYYGSKDMVNYIVLYNEIKNPDLIQVGMSLAIPELRLK